LRGNRPSSSTAGQCEAVQSVDQGVGGDAVLDQAGKALPGVFVDDRHQLDDPERAVTGLSTERLVIREDAVDKLAPLLPRLHEKTRVGCREATTTLESMTIWLTRF
jgi:hypothetical protein